MNKDLFNWVTLIQCTFNYQKYENKQTQRNQSNKNKNKVYESSIKTFFTFKYLVNLKHWLI